jgi:hypothetical protein
MAEGFAVGLVALPKKMTLKIEFVLFAEMLLELNFQVSQLRHAAKNVSMNLENEAGFKVVKNAVIKCGLCQFILKPKDFVAENVWVSGIAKLLSELIIQGGMEAQQIFHIPTNGRTS